jgi:hypothetical protein
MTRAVGLSTNLRLSHVQSTPLAGAVAQVNGEARGSLERDGVAKWQDFVKDSALMLEVRMVVATARMPQGNLSARRALDG